MKKHVLQLLTFSMIILGAIGCVEETVTPTPEPDTNHAYMGTWEGTFSGGDNGTWEMLADKDGKFSGEFYSNSSQTYHPVSGAVDDQGKFSATIDVNGVILDFEGQGVDGKTASGNWGNPSANITGTWSGAKL